MDILVSGSSTGIGRAIAVNLARQGHTVWAGVRSETAIDDLRGMKIPSLKPLLLDVTDEKSLQECVSLVRKKSGLLHGLVNNAGIAVGGPIEAVKIEDWRRQFEVNVFGQVRLTQLCLPLLRDCKGRVVMMSSIAGRVASPFLGPYAASKFALEAIADSLRREMKRFGVQVSVIEPGPIDTPIWDKSRREGSERLSDFSLEIREIYGPMLEKFNERIQEATDSASPVSVVVKAAEHALTARRPRTRYPVGRGIAFSAALSSLLPDRLMDQMLG